ncbi:tetratricopeptide repeat protein [Oleomonas cavernae]|nr:tetratricopeptide repeat protein [Oleomonas cavernae]
MSATAADPELSPLEAMVAQAKIELEKAPDAAVAARLLDGSRRLVDALMSRRLATEAAAVLDEVWDLPGLADFGIESAILGFLSVRVLQASNRHEEAIDRAIAASARIAATKGDGRGLGAPLQADLAQARAASYETLGRREEARDAQGEAVARRAGLIGRNDLPDQRAGLASARNALGRLHLSLGNPDAAVAELETCLAELHEIAQATDGNLPPMLFNVHAAASNRLGRALVVSGKPYEAHPHLVTSVEAMRSLVNETRNLGLVEDFLTALGDLEKAEREMGNDRVAANLAAEAVRWRDHVKAQQQAGR